MIRSVYWNKNWNGIHSLDKVTYVTLPLYDIDKILERFDNKRMTTEQFALPELSIEVG